MKLSDATGCEGSVTLPTEGAAQGSNGSNSGDTASAPLQSAANGSSVPFSPQGTADVRYPGTAQQSLRQPLRPRAFDDRELVRLMLQQLQDMGYTDSFRTLERESGLQLEDPVTAEFRRNVLGGNWDAVESYLLSNVNEHNRRSVQFIIRQQQFLELLEEQRIKKALSILQQELVHICDSPAHLHYLSRLLMCSTSEELRLAAKWAGVKGGSRMSVLEALQRYIPPCQMVPPHRLETLLGQAAKYQRCDDCEFHVRNDIQSLFVDHYCPRSLFPQKTVKILDGHDDEVWFVAFSNNGRYLASASKDQKCIIWDTK
ncbi:hypothetical protein EV182_005968, partial [Spiromyces aspiralis]